MPRHLPGMYRRALPALCDRRATPIRNASRDHGRTGGGDPLQRGRRSERGEPQRVRFADLVHARSSNRNGAGFRSRKRCDCSCGGGERWALGSTTITRHPWLIPVAECDRSGRPLNESNLACSMARRGLRAPGEAITSLSPDGGGVVRHSGTSAAAPFVSASIALLWSLNPGASAASIRHAILASSGRTRSIVPALLDAWSAYRALKPSVEGNREPRIVATGKSSAARISAG
jgi:hypothetical protein